MNTLLDRSDAPDQLFNIPELDFSGDLFVDPVAGQWVRLGAWTIKPRRDERDVENVISRQSLLIAPASFAKMFDRLESIGNVLGNLGKPGGSVLYGGNRKEYRYGPFHRFEFPFTSVTGEPLVFTHDAATGTRLLINPDLWLFFELEEKKRGNGIWWDPSKGVEALRQRLVERDNLEVVEIRSDYLLKYLQKIEKIGSGLGSCIRQSVALFIFTFREFSKCRNVTRRCFEERKGDILIFRFPCFTRYGSKGAPLLALGICGPIAEEKGSG